MIRQQVWEPGDGLRFIVEWDDEAADTEPACVGATRLGYTVFPPRVHYERALQEYADKAEIISRAGFQRLFLTVLSDTLSSKWSGAEWSIEGNDYSTLVWFSKSPKPEENEILAAAELGLADG